MHIERSNFLLENLPFIYLFYFPNYLLTLMKAAQCFEWFACAETFLTNI